mmetsp:Transcript_8863/g.21132  ORF Transcript_8863/g.21132 Transcript_8863/m.21132 type:complete len:223 (-) Transcript_8863:576-1244(-)
MAKNNPRVIEEYPLLLLLLLLISWNKRMPWGDGYHFRRCSCERGSGGRGTTAGFLAAGTWPTRDHRCKIRTKRRTTPGLPLRRRSPTEGSNPHSGEACGPPERHNRADRCSSWEEQKPEPRNRTKWRDRGTAPGPPFPESKPRAWQARQPKHTTRGRREDTMCRNSRCNCCRCCRRHFLRRSMLLPLLLLHAPTNLPGRRRRCSSSSCCCYCCRHLVLPVPR